MTRIDRQQQWRGRRRRVERRLGVVSAYGGDITWIPDRRQSRCRAVHRRRLAAVDRRIGQWQDARDQAWRPGGVPRMLWRDRDERWFSPTGRDSKLLVSPDGKSVAFVSDRTGWIHIYVMPVDATAESQAKQLRRVIFWRGLGSWSRRQPADRVSPQRAGNQMERFIDVVDVRTGSNEPIVTARGVNYDPLFAPDGRQLVFHRTDVENSLDLYTCRRSRECASPVRLSDSMPAGLEQGRSSSPVTPVSFPSRLDKKPVPATLMVPKNLDRDATSIPRSSGFTDRDPIRTFSAGIPGSYRMYYSVCQYLVQQGYVILTPDYRGSSGYSRDWATGVHMGLGVNDTADVASGADYLKTLDYVDPDRIGVLGLSYGGFLTLQAHERRSDVVARRHQRGGRGGLGHLRRRLHDASSGNAGAESRRSTRCRRRSITWRSWRGRCWFCTAPTIATCQFRDSLRVVRRADQARQAVRDGSLSWRDPLLPPRHRLRDAWRRTEEFFDRTVKHGPVMASK